MQRSEHFGRSLAALLTGATGIGIAPILVRQSEVGPIATAFYRLLFALPLLFIWWRLDAKKGRAQPTTKDFSLLFAAGFFFAADMALWNLSLHYTSVASSTLLTNCAPIVVMVAGYFLFGERVTGILAIGAIVAFAGAGLLVVESWQTSSRHLFGDGLALTTAVVYAGYLLVTKKLRSRFSTGATMYWSGVVSAALLGITAYLAGENMAIVSGRGALVLGALAIVSHVGGQGMIAYGLAHLPAGFSSVTLLWQPVVAAILASLLLNEPLTALKIAGGALVLLGIMLASVRR